MKKGTSLSSPDTAELHSGSVLGPSSRETCVKTGREIINNFMPILSFKWNVHFFKNIYHTISEITRSDSPVSIKEMDL